jgi:chromosomal replication initiation ATPase DnaA
MLVQATEDLWAVSPTPRRDRLTVAFVTHLVAMATDVSPSDIANQKRKTIAAVRARQIAMYLTHVSFHWPLARVAFAFGRDRTTCGYACHKVEDLRENIAFDTQMAVLEGCLRQAPLKVTEVSL